MAPRDVAVKPPTSHLSCRSVCCAGAAALCAACVYSPSIVYRSDFKDVDYDYVRDGSSIGLGSANISDLALTFANLSRDVTEDFERKGYVVVRGAVARAAVHELLRSVERSFPLDRHRSRDDRKHGGQWALKARSPWMDSADFASFALHRGSPLGGLAAQVLNVTTVRLGNEALNLLLPGQRGSPWHRDVQNNFRSGLSPRQMPFIRFWMPLSSEDIVAAETGGSLTLLPLDAGGEIDFDSCFREVGRHLRVTKACQERVDVASVSPDVAIGDVLLYSPLLRHRTQALLQGERTAYVGTLYDPQAIGHWVREEPVPSHTDAFRYHNARSMAFDFLCIMRSSCWDAALRQCHHNQGWQSGLTQGASESTSACFPQVYPGPLDTELEMRREKLVVNPFGPQRVFLRWCLHTFPALRLGIVMPLYLLLDNVLLTFSSSGDNDVLTWIFQSAR